MSVSFIIWKIYKVFKNDAILSNLDFQTFRLFLLWKNLFLFMSQNVLKNLNIHFLILLIWRFWNFRSESSNSRLKVRLLLAFYCNYLVQKIIVLFDPFLLVQKIKRFESNFDNAWLRFLRNLIVTNKSIFMSELFDIVEETLLNFAHTITDFKIGRTILDLFIHFLKHFCHFWSIDLFVSIPT